MLSLCNCPYKKEQLLSFYNSIQDKFYFFMIKTAHTYIWNFYFHTNLADLLRDKSSTVNMLKY